MKAQAVVLSGLFFLVLLAPSVGAVEETITVYIEAEIGINVSADCGGSSPSVLSTPVGEPGGCLLTIKNTGNIKDTIRLEAPLSTGYQDDRGWIDYHFECPGTVGECSLEYSYKNALPEGGVTWPEVRNIRLTPKVDTTRVYLEAIPYKIYENSKIDIVAYSLTNRTKEKESNITVDGVSKKNYYGPFVAPGISGPALLVLFLLSGAVFYATKLG